MADKVTVLLRSVGDAPILKNKKYNIDSSHDIAWLTHTIRTLLKLEPNQSLFLYISQTFAPSPDHTLDLLRKCYCLEQSNELVIHYSTTPAWG
ncbi:lgg-3 [Pristionchus pacificus]|nr:lgg-3 [Pristionchus pacificus]